MHPDRTFVIDPRATHLTVTWSFNPDRVYTIPVTHDEDPPFAYGFSIDLTPSPSPRADGTYAPGSDVTFRITLRDGDGQRLHPWGSLPTYNEVVFGPNLAGIQYYRAFFDPTTTYYRRKHRERMLMSQIIGPAQDVQAIRSILDLRGVPRAGRCADDRDPRARRRLRAVPHHPHRARPLRRCVRSRARGLGPPRAGLVDVPPPGQRAPRHLPRDDQGTTHVHGRGYPVLADRRDPGRHAAPHHGPPRRTGPCTTCHTGPSALGTILHANDNRAACAGCHVPLGFELEGPIFVRTHFIHSRSHRFDAPLTKCASCHLTEDEHPADQQSRVSLVPHELSAVPRQAVRPHREHVRWRRPRIVPVLHFHVSHDSSGSGL